MNAGRQHTSSAAASAWHSQSAGLAEQAARRARDPLLWWHLLSLDAPSVAAVWTVYVARVAHLALPRLFPATMFLAVWVLYAADRLLDTRAQRPGDAAALEARHLYHREHRTGFRAGLALASVALLPLVAEMPRSFLTAYLALAALLLAWFALIHLLQRTRAERLPKELAPGFFFAAAVFVPELVTHPQPAQILAALLFGALCALNCMFIYAWEHAGTSSAACNVVTRAALGSLGPLAAVCAVAPVLLAFALPPLWPLALPLSLSALLLMLLHTFRGSVSREHLRAGADLLLLTPLLFFGFAR